MAKTKAELLSEAKALKLDVSEKNTVKEINEAIKNAAASKNADEKPENDSKTAVAKAGKRSAKALREEKELEEKEARKQSAEKSVEKPKQKQNPTRPRSERRAKGYKESAKKIEKGKAYDLKEAIALAVSTSHVSFDATVELHARLNVDPRQADQNIRDSIVLPSGTGKTVRVGVFADAEDANTAKKAGADIAGEDKLLQELEKGSIAFDILIATPSMMPKLSKYARILGPKGLMPNPKSGTVTNDIEKAVKEAKAGKIEYRVDESGIIHAPIGKVSFGEDKVLNNATELLRSIKSNKPSSLKGSFVKSIYVTTSMGPSILVQSSELAA